jgi:hypothetical protein
MDARNCNAEECISSHKEEEEEEEEAEEEEEDGCEQYRRMAAEAEEEGILCVLSPLNCARSFYVFEDELEK